MPQNDVDHRQHRQRLKERFLQEGLDSFDPVNILELMLFYAIPQGDTNPTAHRLLDTFGSLSGVMNASVENLCQVKGVGQHGRHPHQAVCGGGASLSGRCQPGRRGAPVHR